MVGALASVIIGAYQQSVNHSAGIYGESFQGKANKLSLEIIRVEGSRAEGRFIWAELKREEACKYVSLFVHLRACRNNQKFFKETQQDDSIRKALTSCDCSCNHLSSFPFSLPFSLFLTCSRSYSFRYLVATASRYRSVYLLCSHHRSVRQFVNTICQYLFASLSKSDYQQQLLTL